MTEVAIQLKIQTLIIFPEAVNAIVIPWTKLFSSYRCSTAHSNRPLLSTLLPILPCLYGVTSAVWHRRCSESRPWQHSVDFRRSDGFGRHVDPKICRFALQKKATSFFRSNWCERKNKTWREVRTNTKLWTANGWTTAAHDTTQRHTNKLLLDMNYFIEVNIRLSH